MTTSFDLEASVDYPENIPATPAPDYDAWLARGRELAETHSGHQWALGDWLNEGQNQFDIAGSIPGYLLLHKKAVSDNGTTNQFTSSKVPSFWKDAAEEVGMAVSTLKDYAWVARAYPYDQRIPQLPFCHHLIVSGYERRLEYLRACLREGERPRSFEWLRAFAQEQEGVGSENTRIHDGGPLHLQVPDKFWKKLQDLRRYHSTGIADLVQDVCFKAIDQYIEAEGRRISLEMFDIYEGRWPFEVVAEKKKARQSKDWRGRKRNRRRMNDSVFSEKMRQVNITRHSKLGRIR